KEDIATVQGKTDDIKAFIGNNEQFFKDLQESIGSVTDIDLQAFVEKYEDEIEPKMLAEIHAGQETVNEAKGMINDISNAIPEIEKMLNETDTKIDEGQEALDTLFSVYPQVQDRVNTLADTIREVQDEADMQEIVDLLLNDREKEKGFFAQKVMLMYLHDLDRSEIEKMLNETDTKIDEGQEALDTLFSVYPQVQDRVNTLADTIREVQDEADMQEIVDLLLNDPEKEKGFFAEPVMLMYLHDLA